MTRSYTPTSTFSAAPAWLPDGSGFLADIYADTGTSVYQYSVTGGLAGAVAHANSSAVETLP